MPVDQVLARRVGAADALPPVHRLREVAAVIGVVKVDARHRVDVADACCRSTSSTSTPSPLLPSAAVPAALVPMKLPATVFEFEPPLMMHAVVVVARDHIRRRPPIVLLLEPLSSTNAVVASCRSRACRPRSCRCSCPESGCSTSSSAGCRSLRFAEITFRSAAVSPPIVLPADLTSSMPSPRVADRRTAQRDADVVARRSRLRSRR